MGRYDRLREFRRLDPDRDYHRIYRDMALLEFPWDMSMGIQLGFYRTFAVPGISALLDRTGEMTGHTQRRLDNTAILIFEAVVYGFGHERGLAAVRQMRRVHGAATRRAGPWRIPNHEFVYVLGTFVIPVLRWLDAYAWRPLCCHERTAVFRFYQELGRLMGVRDVPATLPEFETWFDAYEREHFGYTPANQRQWDATRAQLTELFAAWLPAPLAAAGRRLADTMANALLDEPLRAALGVGPVPPAAIFATRLAFRARGRLVRWLPVRTKPTYQDELETPSYPDGYVVSEIGLRPSGRTGCSSDSISRSKTGG
jgi:uncharacterized protein (DUF2236 family)